MRLKFACVFIILSFFASFAFCEKAPDFMLRDMNGNTVRLSDYAGKTVFLDFWATWCPPCRQSVPAVKQIHKSFAGNPNVAVLAINAGENEAVVKKFIKDNGMNYAVLNGNREIMQNYKVNAIPSFFIIDKKGNIVKKDVGFTPFLEKEWELKLKELSKN
jgi:thiol-disulfide isomerase/thioredoxin